MLEVLKSSVSNNDQKKSQISMTWFWTFEKETVLSSIKFIETVKIMSEKKCVLAIGLQIDLGKDWIRWKTQLKSFYSSGRREKSCCDDDEEGGGKEEGSS